MGNRKENFVTGEFYHCYNRGIEKRDVFLDSDHFDYFEKICTVFNQEGSLGGLKEYSYRKNVLQQMNSPLVTIVSYCLNQNHFHLLLRQEADEGVAKFMQKIGTGYTMFFNKKHKRSGSLFQGTFKSKYIHDDLYLKNLSVYINRNNELHNITNAKLFRRSQKQYLVGETTELCDPYPVLNLFDKTLPYGEFHQSAFNFLRAARQERKEVEFEVE
jgi:putative transposase